MKGTFKPEGKQDLISPASELKPLNYLLHTQIPLMIFIMASKEWEI